MYTDHYFKYILKLYTYVLSITFGTYFCYYMIVVGKSSLLIQVAPIAWKMGTRLKACTASAHSELQ